MMGFNKTVVRPRTYADTFSGPMRGVDVGCYAASSPLIPGDACLCLWYDASHR